MRAIVDDDSAHDKGSVLFEVVTICVHKGDFICNSDFKDSGFQAAMKFRALSFGRVFHLLWRIRCNFDIKFQIHIERSLPECLAFKHPNTYTDLTIWNRLTVVKAALQ